MIRVILSIAFILMGIYLFRAFLKAQSEYEQITKKRSKISEIEFKMLRKKIFRRYYVKGGLAMFSVILLAFILLIIKLNLM